MHPAASSPQSSLSIALNFEGDPPEWVELIPPGPDVVGRDGRRWTMTDAEAVIAASAVDEAHPLPLDWEHATEVRASAGLDAPAAGWIEQLEARGGGVWGRVAWTPKGRDQVANREYRFLSPVFGFDKLTGQIIRLVSAGLTNTPNLPLTALNREGLNREQPEEPPLSLANQLRKALGLADDASDEAIVSAVAEAKAANRPAQVDLTKYAPRADYDRACNRVTELEAEIKTRDEQARATAIEAELTAAQEAGKIAPGSVEEYRAMCKAEGGLDAFKALVKTLPVIVPEAERPGRKPPNNDAAGSGLTEEEKAVCRALGQTEEEFAAGKKKEA